MARLGSRFRDVNFGMIYGFAFWTKWRRISRSVSKQIAAISSESNVNVPSAAVGVNLPALVISNDASECVSTHDITVETVSETRANLFCNSDPNCEYTEIDFDSKYEAVFNCSDDDGPISCDDLPNQLEIWCI